MQIFTYSRLVYANVFISLSWSMAFQILIDLLSVLMGNSFFHIDTGFFLTKVLTVYIKIHPGAVFLHIVHTIINQFYTTLVPSLVFLLDSGYFKWRTID
jgi:hypothetical protein